MLRSRKGRSAWFSILIIAMFLIFPIVTLGEPPENNTPSENGPPEETSPEENPRSVSPRSITFTNPIPAEDQWVNETNVIYNITISTEGDNIQGSSIMYRYSLDSNSWTDWMDTDVTVNAPSISVEVPVSFIEGDLNRIRWLASNVSDPFTIIESSHLGFKVLVDETAPYFNFPTPAMDDWNSNTQVTSAITVQDGPLSGIDPDSIQYAVSTSGYDGYSEWRNTGIIIDTQGSDLYCTVTNTVIETRENFIRWKGTDNVGNERISTHIRIQVDLTEITYGRFLPQGWIKTKTPVCSIQINDTSGLGNSRVKGNTLFYSVSTTNENGFGAWSAITGYADRKTMTVSIIPVLSEGRLNFIRFMASDVAGNGPTISPVYTIWIDTLNVTYDDEFPPSDEWQIYPDVTCGVIIADDGGSWVSAKTIEYSISTDGYESDEFGPWKSAKLYTNDEEIDVEVDVLLEDGTDNYIKYRAADFSGNGPTESQPFQVKVDSELPLFSSPFPDLNTWHATNVVAAGVTISDIAGSGIDTGSIEYTVSTGGVGKFGDWLPYVNDEKDGPRIICSVNITLEYGSANYIKWRALDVADSGLSESDPYNIKVNTPPVSVITLPTGNLVVNDTIFVLFDGNKSYDDDGDRITYKWISSIDGVLGTFSYFYTTLSYGTHTVMLYVYDGALKSEGVSVSIMVNSFDYDGDGFPDIIDDDDDNDGFFDVYEPKWESRYENGTSKGIPFTLDASEWLDTDGDGIGNNADPDDDNDGWLDEMDQLPLDPWDHIDSDRDGIGDNLDPDDNNDGVLDAEQEGGKSSGGSGDGMDSGNLVYSLIIAVYTAVIVLFIILIMQTKARTKGKRETQDRPDPRGPKTDTVVIYQRGKVIETGRSVLGPGSEGWDGTFGRPQDTAKGGKASFGKRSPPSVRGQIRHLK